MNTRNIIATLLLLFTVSLGLPAQNQHDNVQPQQEQKKNKKEKKPKKEKEKKKKGKDADLMTLQAEADASQKSATDGQSEKKLEGRIQQLEEQLRQRDEQIKDLNQKLSIAVERQKEAEKKVEQGDINAIFLINTYLEKPYNEQRVKDALERIDKISTPSLENDKQQFRKLFMNYRDYQQDIVNLLREANTNVNLESPLRGRETAQSFISRLRQTSYYRDCYHKNFFIPFLDNLVETAINRLNANDPARGKKATLSDLLPKTK